MDDYFFKSAENISFFYEGICFISYRTLITTQFCEIGIGSITCYLSWTEITVHSSYKEKNSSLPFYSVTVLLVSLFLYKLMKFQFVPSAVYTIADNLLLIA